MKQLELLGTDGCHLCELAQEIVWDVAIEQNISVAHRDIADDDELVERYGVRIPVVRVAGDSQQPDLGWPFDQQQMRDWLQNL